MPGASAGGGAHLEQRPIDERGRAHHPLEPSEERVDAAEGELELGGDGKLGSELLARRRNLRRAG